MLFKVAFLKKKATDRLRLGLTATGEPLECGVTVGMAGAAEAFAENRGPLNLALLVLDGRFDVIPDLVWRFHVGKQLAGSLSDGFQFG